MVDLDAVETDADLAELRQLIENHLAFTESPVAAAVLADWTNSVGNFVKVMPKDYKRVLQEQAQKVSAG
jgi:glutamate synthase domain-containing protein 3